jgi:hypothetical protein
MYWSFLEVLKPSETCYVENIKSTNFILGRNTKSTNLRIHDIVIFNQTTKIDTHKEKYFHSIWLTLIKASSYKDLNTLNIRRCVYDIGNPGTKMW